MLDGGCIESSYSKGFHLRAKKRLPEADSLRFDTIILATDYKYDAIFLKKTFCIF